jgi:hypothetical protein
MSIAENTHREGAKARRRTKTILLFLRVFAPSWFILSLAGGAMADELQFKDDFLRRLVKDVPKILESQDPKTGRFGSGIWIVNDQHAIYPLAAAWATRRDGVENPYYHDPKVLDAIMLGGDALIAAQKPNGQWLFQKKDGSTWGDIYMPWTYSRWIRAFALVKDAMPPDRRAKWEKALTLGYEGILKTELTKPVQNIPAHDAMGLYLAGKVFDKPAWCDASAAYMKKVVGEESPDGFWSEHVGPVINYGFVYVDAVGTYYGMSHDESVLPALTRTASFHAHFTYPDGTPVETVDERNAYERSVSVPNVGFTFSPIGRGFIQHQMELKRKTKSLTISPDNLASFLLFGEEGSTESVDSVAKPQAGDRGAQRYVTSDGLACTVRRGPWFVVMSAYHGEPGKTRWIQDRQNFVSLFHDDCGLILGGGNTKLQPLWSTFTVGDTKLLSHKPGDENPNFSPRAGLVHVPTDAKLLAKDDAIELDYGGVRCSVTIDVSDPHRARLTYSVDSPTADKPVEAHLTLIPQLGKPWRSASGEHGTLNEQPLELKPGGAGAWFEHNGCRISIPKNASVTWPVLPHNPYTKDGHAEPKEGRIVITIPLTPQQPKVGVDFEVQ